MHHFQFIQKMYLKLDSLDLLQKHFGFRAVSSAHCQKVRMWWLAWETSTSVRASLMLNDK